MQSRRPWRSSRSVVIASVALLAFGLPACSGGEPSDSDSGDDAVILELEIVDGELVGGARRDDAALGDSVRLVVSGNSDDQVHVHGYDRYLDLAESGGSGELTFDALIPGRFEIELEGSGQLLIELTVS